MQKHILKFSKIFEKTLFWLVLTLFLFIPLYQKYPAIRIPATFVSVRLEDFLILAVTIVLFLYLYFSKKFNTVLKDKLTLAFLVFFFIGLVSLFSAIFITHSVRWHLALFHYLRRIEMMILLFVGLFSVNKLRDLKVFLLAFSFVALVVSFYALGQKFLKFPSISTVNPELSKGVIYYLTPSDRPNSTFAGHYDLAVFLLMVIIVLVAIFFYYWQKLKTKLISKKNTVFTLIYLGSVGFISSYVLVMTAARLSFFALILGLIFVLILLKKKTVLLGAIFIVLFIILYPSQLQQRLISTIKINVLRQWSGYQAVSEAQEARSKLNIPTLPTGGKRTETIGADAPDIVPGEPVDTTELAIYRSFQIRTQVEWPRAIRAFLTNPFLGTGYSSIGLATDNDFLRSLGEVGLLGTFAFILILWEATKRLWRSLKESKGFLFYYLVGLLAMIFAFLVNSLFIDVFEASKIASLFWLMVGAGLKIGNLSKKHVA